MKKFIKYMLVVFLVLFVAVVAIVIESNLSRDSEVTYELRGRYKPSLDGKTYLVIEDDNGGKCGPLFVDKKEWLYGLNNKGEVKPGDHIIECGTWMGVTVQEGTIYYLNYWGP